MNTSLTGTWVNSYGSQMQLTESNGHLVGEYTSSTGSSGTYLLYGAASTTGPTSGSNGTGQNLVLSIYWRSIDGGPSDPTWHWVSTYCGQLQADGTMTVINSLVATTPFAEIGAIPGANVDKLTFTKQSETSKPALFEPQTMDSSVACANPINGEWSGANVQLALQVIESEKGILAGSLIYQGELIYVFGFTDTHVDGATELQSISVSGFVKASGQAISLSGSLDLNTQQLNLSRWLALSTTPGNAYLQSNMEAWTLLKL